MTATKWRLLVSAGLLTCALIWWFLREPASQASTAPQNRPAITTPSESATTPADLVAAPGDSAPRESASKAAYRTVEVVNPDGRAIEGAEVIFTERIDTTVRKSDRQSLGKTDATGRLRVPQKSLPEAPIGYLAARARGFLPTYLANPEADVEVVQLVVSPEHRQQFRCVDLEGAPVPGVVVMISRKAVPPQFAVDGFDAEVEAGFDPIDAVLAAQSDESGMVEFGELRRGYYKLAIVSEYYERLVDRKERPGIEIPGPTHEIVLSPLLCGVVKVVGDEMYTSSVTTNADLWLPPSGDNRRSMSSLYRRLADRYPEALVYVNALPSAQSTVTSVPAELWLAHTGKQIVNLQLLPAYSDPKPMVITVEPDDTAPPNVSNVTFKIRDAAGRLLDCPELRAYREKAIIPLLKQITPSKPLRLPYGRWRLATQYYLLDKHYQPEFFDISTPDAQVDIQLDIELVPVRVVPIGHRGQREQMGNLRFTQFGRTEQCGILDETNLWLRPGNTEWYFGTDHFYEPFERMIPVRPTPEGEVQTIRLDLVLKNGR